jgi:hypothetical protein
MPRITVIFGILLILLGVGGYVVAVQDGKPSVTALIPTFFGVILSVCGVLAFKENLLKHAMHGAAAFGLLGFLAPAGRLMGKLAAGDLNLASNAILAQIIMAALCLVFVGLCVRSFIETRRQRRLAGN